MSVKMKQEYKKKLTQALNEQLNIEMYAAYFYLNCFQYCDRPDVNLPFVAKYFSEEYKKEFKHAENIIKYMNARELVVNFTRVEMPTFGFESLHDVFAHAYEYEFLAWKHISDISDLAAANKDPSTVHIFDSLLDDQIKIEQKLKKILHDVHNCDLDPFKYSQLDKSLFRKMLKDEDLDYKLQGML